MVTRKLRLHKLNTTTVGNYRVIIYQSITTTTYQGLPAHVHGVLEPIGIELPSGHKNEYSEAAKEALLLESVCCELV